jgi:hypothetical protein
MVSQRGEALRDHVASYDDDFRHPQPQATNPSVRDLHLRG